VVPGETGLLVPPQRPGLLAAAVRYLLDSPAVAARMAEAAHARLGDHHGEPELRAALLAAYGAIAGTPACPHPPPLPPSRSARRPSRMTPAAP